MVEQPLVDGRLRGWIDLLAFDRSSGRVLVVEVKTELRDIGGLQRQVAWYAGAAHNLARGLGWRTREVCCLVAFLATEENDIALAGQRATIDAGFPVRGRALRDAIDKGAPFDGWGVTMIDPRRRGSRAWMGLRLDGRRREAPYRSYGDFMRVVRASTAPPVRARRASRAGVGSQSVRPVSRQPPVRETSSARTAG